VVWVLATVAVPRFLPSLASVTQGNNANFLRPARPASTRPISLRRSAAPT